MKIVKNKTDIISNISTIAKYVRFKPDNYVLDPTEEDVTCKLYIDECRSFNIIDYKQARECYIWLAKDFEYLDIDVRDSICEYIATDMETAITHYMIEHEMTQEEATSKFVDNWSNKMTSISECYTNYIKSPKYKFTIIMAMPMNECERYLAETRNLSLDYMNAALQGTNYGDVRSGIMDYIENTGDYIDPSVGLKSFALNPGVVLSDLILQLQDILVNGNIN